MNLKNSELDSRQVFYFVGYHFDLRCGLVRLTPDQWQTLQEKIHGLISRPACPVWHFLIGLLTAIEKQVHFGWFHMRPIRRHLKNNWRVLEKVTRKGHSHSKVLASPSKVVAGGKQCALKRAHCKRNLIPSRKQAAYKVPRTEGRLFGPKRVLRPLLKQDSFYSNRQHHSSIIHKQGGPLCAFLWRILIWCTRKQVTLKACHIPGRLNVVADKLSRLGQTIQRE